MNELIVRDVEELSLLKIFILSSIALHLEREENVAQNFGPDQTPPAFKVNEANFLYIF